MTEGSFYWKERYVHIFLIIVSAVILWIIPQQVQVGAPRAIPYLTVSVVLICSIYCLIRCLRKNEVVISFPKSPLFKLTAGIFLYFLYVFWIGYFGFYSLTFIFIILNLFFLKNKRNVKSIILVSVITPLAIYLLLDQLLGVNMPSGFWL